MFANLKGKNIDTSKLLIITGVEHFSGCLSAS